MTDDERLGALLREAFPPISEIAPSRDLWPVVARQHQWPASVSWVDVAIGAVACAALVWEPEWFLWLSYHL